MTGLVITDGAGDLYEVVSYNATFTLRSLDRQADSVVVDSATLRQLGVEWDGRALHHSRDRGEYV